MLQNRNESAYHALMDTKQSILRSKPRSPGIGKGGHKLRGTAAQRREFYEKARAYTDEVLQTLIEIVRDDAQAASDRIAAGKELLNRGWGAAPQVHLVDQTMEHRLSLDVDALRQMSDADIAAYRRLLTTMMQVRGDVMDAEVVGSASEMAQDGRLLER